MRASLIPTAIAVLPFALTSPVSIGLTDGPSSTQSSCADALRTLSAHSIFSIPAKLCHSHLALSPVIETVTSTYNRPLTDVDGIIRTTYADPAPPGTTTIPAPPILTDATTTRTLSITSFDYHYRWFTLTDTTTVSKLCTKTAPALSLAVNSACQCAGFKPRTKTLTISVVKTRGVTTVTTTRVETVSVRQASPGSSSLPSC